MINIKQLEFGNREQIDFIKKRIKQLDQEEPVGEIEEDVRTLYSYDFKCIKCEKRHREEIDENDFDESDEIDCRCGTTYFIKKNNIYFKSYNL